VSGSQEGLSRDEAGGLGEAGIMFSNHLDEQIMLVSYDLNTNYRVPAHFDLRTTIDAPPGSYKILCLQCPEGAQTLTVTIIKTTSE